MRLVIDGVEDGVLEVMGNLRANLSWLRKEHSLTNHDLGLLAGVKERQISVWLNAPIAISSEGEEIFNPRMVNLAKIGVALGIPLSDFFLETAAFAKKHRKLRPLVRLAAAAKPAETRAVATSAPRSSSASTAVSRKRPALSIIAGLHDDRPVTMGALALDLCVTDVTMYSPLCQLPRAA
jgi:hypothetical protein